MELNVGIVLDLRGCILKVILPLDYFEDFC